MGWTSEVVPKGLVYDGMQQLMLGITSRYNTHHSMSIAIDANSSSLI
jgi:hypothetical protein